MNLKKRYIFKISKFFFLINIIGCFQADRIPPKDNTVRSSGFAIKGISVVAPVDPINETALQPITALHANSITIMPYAFCSSDNPIIRYNHKGQWWGESDEGVIDCIQKAHEKKLAVMLKPHLWIGHGTYTGAFILSSEKNWGLWENSYRDYILHYAFIADKLRAEIFCLATELGAAVKERPVFWSSLIDTLKQVYHGKLTYAANWDDYQDFPYWKKLDYIGIDAYFPLSADETPTVNSLMKGWSIYSDGLQKISALNNRPILFTEYGYRNVDYNSVEPWKENEGNQNDKAQVNAFEAFYESFSGKKWFAGGFVWKWHVDNSGHHNGNIDFTPQDKPAIKVIEKWYSN